MFNLPVKLSVMSSPYHFLSPQVFLEQSPYDCVECFMKILPGNARQTVEFTYTPLAILLILENEFEIQVHRQQMVFRKPSIDAQSWLYTNSLPKAPINPDIDDILETLAEALWVETGNFSMPGTSLEERLNLRREIKTLLTLYYYKHGKGNIQSLYALQYPYPMKKFLSLVVAEAIYKADGAKILFGGNSAYYRLWLLKQHQFYRYAKLFQSCTLKQPA